MGSSMIGVMEYWSDGRTEQKQIHYSANSFTAFDGCDRAICIQLFALAALRSATILSGLTGRSRTRAPFSAFAIALPIAGAIE